MSTICTSEEKNALYQLGFIADTSVADEAVLRVFYEKRVQISWFVCTVWNAASSSSSSSELTSEDSQDSLLIGLIRGLLRFPTGGALPEPSLRSILAHLQCKLSSPPSSYDDLPDAHESHAPYGDALDAAAATTIAIPSSVTSSSDVSDSSGIDCLSGLKSVMDFLNKANPVRSFLTRLYVAIFLTIAYIATSGYKEKPSDSVQSALDVLAQGRAYLLCFSAIVPFLRLSTAILTDFPRMCGYGLKTAEEQQLPFGTKFYDWLTNKMFRQPCQDAIFVPFRAASAKIAFSDPFNPLLIMLSMILFSISSVKAWGTYGSDCMRHDAFISQVRESAWGLKHWDRYQSHFDKTKNESLEDPKKIAVIWTLVFAFALVGFIAERTSSKATALAGAYGITLCTLPHIGVEWMRKSPSQLNPVGDSVSAPALSHAA